MEEAPKDSSFMVGLGFTIFGVVGAAVLGGTLWAIVSAVRWAWQRPLF